MYGVALLKVYMQEKIALSACVSFQYSNFILLNFIFLHIGFSQGLGSSAHGILWSCNLYLALVTAVVQGAQQTASLQERVFHTTPNIFCTIMLINTALN